MIRLVLGGEKSGKSDLAYDLFLRGYGAASGSASSTGTGPGMILAMGFARDAGFRHQILTHRMRRDPAVPVMEPGLELSHALDAARSKNAPVLVDSLDFWVFACMEAGEDRADQLLTSLSDWNGPHAPDCVLVSCEVGLGPLAATSLTRRFVRCLGDLNQRLAQTADEVRLAVAGLSLLLKGNGNGLF